MTPDELAQGRARSTPTASLVRLSDIAEVVEDHQPLFGDAVVNDGPGLLLVVEKFPWANTLDVTRGVEQAIEEMKPGLPGIDFDTTIFRPATFIEVALGNLSLALALGCLLVVAGPARVPLRVADRADQPHRDPAVAARGGPRPPRSGRRPSTR